MFMMYNYLVIKCISMFIWFYRNSKRQIVIYIAKNADNGRGEFLYVRKKRTDR